jgi:hypothetical protein
MRKRAYLSLENNQSKIFTELMEWSSSFFRQAVRPSCREFKSSLVLSQEHTRKKSIVGTQLQVLRKSCSDPATPFTTNLMYFHWETLEKWSAKNKRN